MTYSNEDLTSTGTDENALLVTGGKVSLNDVTVTRISSDSAGGDNSSFYGVGAALLATGGTLNTVRLYDSTLTGNMPDLEQNDNTWTVILFHSSHPFFYPPCFIKAV